MLTRLDRATTDDGGSMPALSDADRVDQLAALERVKAVCAAVQARVTVDFAESQERVAVAWRARVKECANGSDFEGWVAAREAARRATVQIPASHADAVGRGSLRRSGARPRRPGAEFGVAGQIALARRESPTRGSRHLALALALVRHLPHTLAALEAGELSEWRAEIIVREASVLTAEQQNALDVELFDTLADSADSADSANGWEFWETGSWPAGSGRSPTGSTRSRSSTGPEAPRGTVGSRSDRRRTPCAT